MERSERSFFRHDQFGRRDAVESAISFELGAFELRVEDFDVTLSHDVYLGPNRSDA